MEGLDRSFDVGFGEPLHLRLLDRGYNSYKWRDTELAMEVDLTRFTTTPLVQEFRRRNEAAGLVFEYLQPQHAGSLRALAPAEWMSAGIAHGAPYAICRERDEVIGFCGGCGVNKQQGLGGWSFIYLKGSTEKLDGPYQRRGIGAVMLAMANEWLKSQGARASLLFTGLGNPTQRLYRNAGYRYCFISAHNVQKHLAPSS